MIIKKFFFASFLLISFFSCGKKDEKIIEGDLTIKLISFGSFYGASEAQITKMEIEFDSIKNSNENYLELIELFSKLKKAGLYKSPYIFVKQKNDSIVRVYLSEKDKEKFKKFTWVSLSKEKKKVKLKLLVEEKDSNIFFMKKILELNKIEGKTTTRK